MTENGLFVLGGPETLLHDIIWAVHDGKNRGRSEGEENIRVSRLRWVVGAERCAFLSYTHTRGCEALGPNSTRPRRWDLTEPPGIALQAARY